MKEHKCDTRSTLTGSSHQSANILFVSSGRLGFQLMQRRAMARMTDSYQSTNLPRIAWRAPVFAPQAPMCESPCSWSPGHRQDVVNRKHAEHRLLFTCSSPMRLQHQLRGSAIL
ncbi:hypothetical protein TGDOM2_358470 [Toxoplasma gondii GAB2-2007-GAL-DOM2]|uniref:Uncharacterized protein n=7 Tax=Toxoplasma gondii TaxID=5811 RepID=A0A125YZ91_TOXGV|nr:hypothetical protein TGGT1_220730 [Toxoplasma gondii GT1]ESS28244.1 hypothetical protein TGVEG_358470 [Toxoplasma gondii VEG]KFG29033.1 hypothetical protein TGDOM2_358470 [Toxoplasma gondii GAB2-2007-GAL-DOM2]KYF38589.1 hypothetical protein TGARI_358470 [Toxoplasma gondii ARI]RQX66646.1 hypothetical protein TGCAST_220730 [Toxoplasma gondii CAST]